MRLRGVQITAIVALFVNLGLSGCMVNGTKANGKTGTNSSGVITGGATTTAQASMTLLPVGAPTQGSGSSLQFSLTLSSSLGLSVSNFCSVTQSIGGATSSTCTCSYQWASAGQPNADTTPLTSMNGNTVTCNVPANSSALNASTLLNISIMSNSGTLVGTGTYSKGASGISGSITTDQGSVLTNISRYSCYEKPQRYTQITSSIGTFLNTANNANTTYTFPYATSFCYFFCGSPANNGTNNCHVVGTSCQGLNSQEYSTQSFYYSLYTNNPGLFYANNSRFYCPVVSNTSPSWPMDSTFALANLPDTTFTVPITAGAVLGKNNDSSTYPQNCGGAPATGANTTFENVISYQCMGYAIQPDATGSCGTIPIKGVQTPTYRLRRYMAIYPPIYEVNGAVTQASANDTIYVLDRPAGLDPDTGVQRTILGPKPCPFAYYDRKNVTGTQQYYGTNNAAWAGKNLDATQLPNADLFQTLGDGTQAYSCSSLMPVVQRSTTDSTGDQLFFDTVNPLNSHRPNAYIRPAQPWAPHYVEDTDFLACAPQSFAPVDAPTYLYQTQPGGPVNWCAATYPNDVWDTTVSSSITRLPTSTDVRMTNSDSSIQFSDPPILAPPSDIYNMLKTDNSYGCSYSSVVGPNAPPNPSCCFNASFTNGQGFFDTGACGSLANPDGSVRTLTVRPRATTKKLPSH